MSRGDETRINQQIRAPRVRLIDASGEMAGIVPIADALKQAEVAGLDLVEIVPNSEPPVAKIMDFGKFRYEQQKKQHEARKKQKVIVVKEVKLRPMIGEHDLEIKLKNAVGWLAEGDKVKFSLKFRGREMAHQDLGFEVIKRVQEFLTDQCKPEYGPRLEGNQLIFIVAPK